MIVIDILLHPIFLLNSHVVILLHFHLLSCCLYRILYSLAIASVWDDLAELFELTLYSYDLYRTKIVRDVVDMGDGKVK